MKSNNQDILGFHVTDHFNFYLSYITMNSDIKQQFIMIKNYTKQVHKTAAARFKSIDRRRKRRNSKFERCKNDLDQSQLIAHQIGDITVKATKENEVSNLKPFVGNNNQLIILSPKPKNKIAEKSISQILYHTQYIEESSSREKRKSQLKQSSVLKTTKKSNNSFRKSVQKKFNDILDPQKSIYKSTFINVDMKVPKTSIQLHQEQYIGEMKKIYNQQYRFKKRIGQRFIQKYPDKKQYLQDTNVLHTSMTGASNISKRDHNRAQTQTESSDNIINIGNFMKRNPTAFYSRSRKKCMIQKFVVDEGDTDNSVSKDLEKIKSFTFIEYLGNDNARRQFKIKSKSRKNVRCTTLIKIQDDILKIVKAGSKDEKQIKKCLDEIIIDNLMK